jgi:hypothetical protein
MQQKRCFTCSYGLEGASYQGVVGFRTFENTNTIEKNGWQLAAAVERFFVLFETEGFPNVFAKKQIGPEG